jgi:SAM-dependent methyltransferase
VENRATRWLARALYTSLRADRLVQAGLKGRNELALLLGGEAFFSAYNDVAYAAAQSYSPSSPRFREWLFGWEQAAIERYFRAPPARLLVGGAGGGREAFALADMGYRVTAFEPTEELASAMAKATVERDRDIEVYVGSYESLWSGPDRSGSSTHSPPSLPAAPELGQFDAIVLGWGSFTHVRQPHGRERVLQVCHQLLSPGGTVLASYFAAPSPTASAPSRLSKLQRRIRRARGVDPNDHFYPHAGVVHAFTPEEIRALASGAGLEVLFTHDEMRGVYPHSVMKKPL